MKKTRIIRCVAVICLVCLAFGMLGAVVREDLREMRPVGTLTVAPVEQASPENASAEESPEYTPEPSPKPTAEPTPEPTEKPSEATPTPPVTPSAEDREPEIIVAAPAGSVFCNGSYCGAYIEQDGRIYVCVQGVVAAMDESANFKADSCCLQVEAEGVSIRICKDWSYFICNERYLYVPEGILWRDDGVYVPADELAKCFGAGMSMDEETGYLSIQAETIVPLAPGSEFYNEDDLYWLSHVIYAESGCESLEGQIAVGNVVLNRVKSPIFKNQDDIYSVIFAEGQFEVVDNGTIYLEPTEKSILAAKIALEGYEILPGALFFAQGYMGSGFTILAWIGAHCFMTLA